MLSNLLTTPWLATLVRFSASDHQGCRTPTIEKAESFHKVHYRTKSFELATVFHMRRERLPAKGILIIFYYLKFTAAFIAPRGIIGVRARQTRCSYLYSSMSNATMTEVHNLTTVELNTDHLSITLLDLVGRFTDKLPISTINDASTSLEHFLTASAVRNREVATTYITLDCAQERLANRVVLAAMNICQPTVNTVNTLRSKKAWMRLQEAGAALQTPSSPTESIALSIASVFCCLAIMGSDLSKAAASAMSSTLVRNKHLQDAGHDIATHVLQVLLIHASTSHILNLNILVQFARSFNLDNKNGRYSELSANVIRHALCLDQTDTMAQPEKQIVNGALALACQIQPWPVLAPVLLVDAALQFDFWTSAEEICMRAQDAAVMCSSSATEHNSSLVGVIEAVEALINAAMEAKTYRRADKIATNLYDAGGNTRYVEARLCHACDTIAKVVMKQKLAIIERQVERVDKAVAKAGDDTGAAATVRSFALQQLEEAGETDSAHRLAMLWNLDHAFDEDAISAAAAARRQKFLQWDEAILGNIPDLISTPDDLIRTFGLFRMGKYVYGPFGMDAEWDEDSNDVAVLQLAHPHQVLLIDIPALTSTLEGVKALEQTVGLLLRCSLSVVVGFACRQDLSRLRASRSVGGTHWISGTSAVVDAQSFIADAEPNLSKLGLSRIVETYFGKPLDKAEQCSMWSRRPLSERQRVYASLDAWVCVALHQRFFPGWSPLPGGPGR